MLTIFELFMHSPCITCHVSIRSLLRMPPKKKNGKKPSDAAAPAAEQTHHAASEGPTGSTDATVPADSVDSSESPEGVEHHPTKEDKAADEGARVELVRKELLQKLRFLEQHDGANMPPRTAVMNDTLRS